MNHAIYLLQGKKKLGEALPPKPVKEDVEAPNAKVKKHWFKEFIGLPWKLQKEVLEAMIGGRLQEYANELTMAGKVETRALTSSLFKMTLDKITKAHKTLSTFKFWVYVMRAKLAAELEVKLDTIAAPQLTGVWIHEIMNCVSEAVTTRAIPPSSSVVFPFFRRHFEDELGVSVIMDARKVVLGGDGDILIPDWKSKDQTDAFNYDGIISNSLLLKSGLNGWADRIREVIVSDSNKVSDNVS